MQLSRQPHWLELQESRVDRLTYLVMDFLVEAQNLEVDFVVRATYVLFYLNKLMMVVTLRPDKSYLWRVGSRKLQLFLGQL